MCVGCPYSPQSLTCVNSWGFVRLPPSRNSNYLGYNILIINKIRFCTQNAVSGWLYPVYPRHTSSCLCFRPAAT
ncbi:hypothetical protein DF215_00520 [Pectobacterium versatile]|nr:hypothetical protein DF215_00520 [Pectobacterium versatile]